ncbi:MAG: site-specific integrase [Bacteroidetes bacterium]|nr:site-specific integrase [Bacteroidota bacterium]
MFEPVFAMSSSLKVILFKGKVLSNGEHPILIRVIKDRKSSYLSIGASSTFKNWDKGAGLPKKSHPDFKHLVLLIDTKRAEASSLLFGVKTEGIDISAHEIKDKIKAVPIKASMTVGKYFDEFIERMENANRIGYADAFRYTKNSIMNYRDGSDFSFGEVTTSFLVKYEEYLDGRDLAPNTIFLYMRTFKTLINYARKDGIVKKEYDPFEGISFAKYRRVKTRKRALPKETILKIMNLGLTPESHLYNYWNFFRFSYLCWGMNFIDTAYLKWEDIHGDTLVYTRQKTGDEFNILLAPQAHEILEYYRKAKLNPKAPYVFPIFNETHITAKSKSYRAKKVLKQYNDALKEIGEMIGITTKLTSYVARHSFANVLRQNGVSTTIIKDAMGHESEAMTEVYTSQLDASILGNTINNSLL